MEWTEVAGVVGAMPGVDSREFWVFMVDEPVLLVDEGLWCALRAIVKGSKH